MWHGTDYSVSQVLCGYVCVSHCDDSEKAEAKFSNMMKAKTIAVTPDTSDKPVQAEM